MESDLTSVHSHDGANVVHQRHGSARETLCGIEIRAMGWVRVSARDSRYRPCKRCARSVRANAFPCPRDSNGDGNCGEPACPYCGDPAKNRRPGGW